MTRKIHTASRRRPSAALVISCVALFLALAGSALALPKNTVRSAQIVNGTIRTVDLRDEAVKSAKVADQSLTANDLAPDSVGSEEIAENAVASPEVAPDSLTAEDLGANSVASAEIAPNAVGSEELAANSVNSVEIATDAVNASEVANNAISADELAAVTVRTNSEPIEGGKNGAISVPCQAGEQVLSGGGAPSAFGVEMTSSAPTGNGWYYAASNKNAGDATLTVYAVCLAA
jgi:hypothetical protein